MMRAERNDVLILFVSTAIVWSFNTTACNARYIDKQKLNENAAPSRKFGGLLSAENRKSRSKHEVDDATSLQSSTSQPQHDHDLDTKCRTIYADDKDALLKIQGAVEGILKVIDRMDIESRPSKPVSAFIKLPKDYAMDKDGHPTADTQKAIKDQIINKEGFTISYDDKLYLELIQTAAEEIRTQLLHLDLDERPGVQRPASGKGQGQASQNHQKLRKKRSIAQTLLNNNLTEQHTTSTLANLIQEDANSQPHDKTDSAKAVKQLASLQSSLKSLHNEIDDIGRKMREDYLDNTNMERTDIKSSSDNLKKLQGMIAATNHTLLKQLYKMYNEQAEAYDYLERKIDMVENILMKLFLRSVDKKLGGTILGIPNSSHRVTKSIDEIDTVRDDDDVDVDEVDGDDEDDDYDDLP